jgi:hypothetical protein
LPVSANEEKKEFDLLLGEHVIEWIYQANKNEYRAKPLAISYIRIEGTGLGSAEECLKCPEVKTSFLKIVGII